MRVVVYGAGGIGGTIGARLYQQGVEVVLIARGEHLSALQTQGLRFVAPDGDFRLAIATVANPAEINWRAGDVVILTMKSQHTTAALETLALSAPQNLPVVCGQNGVANEAMALRRFPNVYAMLINLPASHLEPGEVVSFAQGIGGILDTGRFPTGVDGVVEELTGLLEQAGFSARPDPLVMRKKYAKLLANLGNSLQAAVTPADAREATGQDAENNRTIARMLRQEALACYAAAGIDCASRDEVRARHDHRYSMVEVPGFPRLGGSSWQSIFRGTGDIETDYLNGEIVWLGRCHGVATPANEVCQGVALRLLRDGLATGAITSQEILELIEVSRTGSDGADDQ
jgi:2-dehydropantoate 2-reductase